METIQSFGNTGAHDSRILPEDMENTDIMPVLASLKHLYDWYKNEIEPRLGVPIVPFHHTRMSKNEGCCFEPNPPEISGNEI